MPTDEIVQVPDATQSIPDPSSAQSAGGNSTPARTPSKPEQEAKPEVKVEAPKLPAISPEYIALAEDLGFSRAEAAQFTSQADLTRALRFAARHRQQAPKQEVAPEPEPELDVPEFTEEDAFDPRFGKLAKVVKQLKDELKASREEAKQFKEIIPRLQQAETIRLRERTDKEIDDAVKDAGHDSSTMDQQKRAAVWTMAKAIHDGQKAIGLEITQQQAFKLAAPMVMGQGQQVQQVQQQTPRQVAASARERAEHGHFAPRPGDPTHRGSGLNGNKLRELLVDNGNDPGPMLDAVKDTSHMFLPG